jgi:hypothetical protein
VSTRTVSKSWFEVVLPNPTIGAELYLAMRWAEQEYKTRYGRDNEWDNTFEVVGGDEEIVIRFEVLKEKH